MIPVLVVVAGKCPRHGQRPTPGALSTIKGATVAETVLHQRPILRRTSRARLRAVPGDQFLERRPERLGDGVELDEVEPDVATFPSGDVGLRNVEALGEFGLREARLDPEGAKRIVETLGFRAPDRLLHDTQPTDACASYKLRISSPPHDLHIQGADVPLYSQVTGVDSVKRSYAVGVPVSNSSQGSNIK